MRPGVLHIAGFVTIAFAAWQALSTPTPTHDPVSDQIDAGLRAYRSLTADLPDAGRIGFVATTADDAFNSANHYLAQYALAPRLVLRAFEASQVPFVVTGVNSASEIGSHPQLAGYELVAVRDFGIRIFRRTTP